MVLGAKGRRKVLPCVLVDVNTQIDFLSTDGACPVANREELYPALRRVVAWAKRNQVAVVSSIDSHRRDEVRHSRLPEHCLDDTPGQTKVGFTLFGSHVQVEGDCTLAVPIDLFRKHQQVIFRKRTTDFFLNPKADRFMTQLPAAEYVVTGMCIEGSVRAIALGLVARNKPVSVVVDACGYFDRSEADLALRQLGAKGVNLIEVSELVARRLPRPVRYSVTGRREPIVLGSGTYTTAKTPAGGNGRVSTEGSPNGKSNGKVPHTAERRSSAPPKP